MYTNVLSSFLGAPRLSRIDEFIRREIKTSKKLKITNSNQDMYRLFREKSNIVASFVELLEFPEQE